MLPSQCAVPHYFRLNDLRHLRDDELSGGLLLYLDHLRLRDQGPLVHFHWLLRPRHDLLTPPQRQELSRLYISDITNMTLSFMLAYIFVTRLV